MARLGGTGMSEIVRTELTAGVENTASRVRQPENEELKRVQQAVQYLNRQEPSPAQDERYPTQTNRLEVGYDDSSHRLVIKLIDSTTKTILLEMPSRDVIRMAADARRAHQVNGEVHSSVEGITA